MKSQVLHTVWCHISGEAAGEIWNWSLLGVKGCNVIVIPIVCRHYFPRTCGESWWDRNGRKKKKRPWTSLPAPSTTNKSDLMVGETYAALVVRKVCYNYRRCYTVKFSQQLATQPAVALAFEEMRTPYASGREVCVQKFVNAYQRKETETNTAFQKHLYH